MSTYSRQPNLGEQTVIKYHAEHCWVNAADSPATVGVSAFAVNKLSEVIYIDLPQPGDELIQGEPFGEVESTKTTSDLIAPVSGRVAETNSGLEDEIGPLNASPEGAGWLCRVELTEPGQVDGLMDPEAYAGACAEED